MDNKPYHHLPDNTFRNPEGSPERDDKIKWSYSTFNKEKKKLDMTVPDDHVLKKENVLKEIPTNYLRGTLEQMVGHLLGHRVVKGLGNLTTDGGSISPSLKCSIMTAVLPPG